MTYSYSNRVANCRLGTFLLLLFTWRASIYKLLYKELILYLFLYFGVSCIYRFALNEESKVIFERLTLYCARYNDYGLLTFILGFYVSWIVNRWWSVFLAICWPDRISIHVATLVHGHDERGRLIRRTLVRWLNLAHVLLLRNVSVPVKSRFLTCLSVKEAGYMTEAEYDYYSKVFAFPENQNPSLMSTQTDVVLSKSDSRKLLFLPKDSTLMKRWRSMPSDGNGPTHEKRDSICAGAVNTTQPVPKRYARGLENDLVWLLPLQWFASLLVKARKEERISSDFSLNKLVGEVCDYRDNLMKLKCYDWISVPLVYTQAATLAVYVYFLLNLISRQYLNPAKQYVGYEVDFYIPIFLILEFLFYVGWLKVAESLIYPLGNQDDHFEINSILDRNAIIGYIFADQQYDCFPRLVKDYHYNDREVVLPHTSESVGNHDNAHVGSAADVGVNERCGEVAITSPNDTSAGIGRRVSVILNTPLEYLRRKITVTKAEPGLDDLESVSQNITTEKQQSAVSETLSNDSNLINNFITALSEVDAQTPAQKQIPIRRQSHVSANATTLHTIHEHRDQSIDDETAYDNKAYGKEDEDDMSHVSRISGEVENVAESISNRDSNKDPVDDTTKL